MLLRKINTEIATINSGPDTLLKSFIKKRLAQYVEPERKGTPRGEPVGFSKQKYHASLMMLYSKRIKALSGEMDISYGLLRKWRTEEDFLHLVHKHARDFLQYVYDSLDNISNKDVLRWPQEVYEEDVTRTLELLSQLPEFRDVNDYGIHILMAGTDWLGDTNILVEKENWKLGEPRFAKRMLVYMLAGWDSQFLKSFMESGRKAIAFSIARNLELIKQLLSKEGPVEETDKGKAISLIEEAEHYAQNLKELK